MTDAPFTAVGPCWRSSLTWLEERVLLQPLGNGFTVFSLLFYENQGGMKQSKQESGSQTDVN